MNINNFVYQYDFHLRILKLLRNSSNLYSLTEDEYGLNTERTAERRIFQNQFLAVYGGKTPHTSMFTRRSSLSRDRGEDWRQPKNTQSGWSNVSEVRSIHREHL